MTDIEDIDLDEKISILSELSANLTSVSPQEFLQTLPAKICSLLDVSECILWQVNQETRVLEILATAGDLDNDCEKIILNLKCSEIKKIFKKNKILFLSNANKAKYKLDRLRYLTKISKGQFTSITTIPLKSHKKKIGIIDIFIKDKQGLKNWQKNAINIITNNALIAFQDFELLKEKEKILNDKKALQDLTEIIHKMTATSEIDEIWKLLKQGAEKIVSSKYIWLGHWNHWKGELELVEANESSRNLKKLSFGKGIITQAIRNEEPIVISDIKDENEPKIKNYVKSWNDSQSELAIPLIDTVPIREKPENLKKFGSKIFGVLNIESITANSFSNTDIDRLCLLSRHAAIKLERLDVYHKSFAIRKVEQEINGAKNHDEIIEIIIKGIKEVLEFDWINISIVNADRTYIKSEHVIGLSPEEEKQFKKEAVHSLNSSDIQADIVRTRNIEVPDEDDPRLDSKIFQSYGHRHLTRVFIPMIEPASDLVIATIEAGYSREYRKYIYEQDIQILKNFVDFAVYALERKKSGWLEKITHEISSPVTGIKGHASLLKKHIPRGKLPPDLIVKKLDDILSDCEIILYQIDKFYHFLSGKIFQDLQETQVFVFRDVIIKTIQQLKPDLVNRNLQMINIKYDSSDARKIVAHTDKRKLNQVVYNLLINSIKYAEDDPRKFQIWVKADEQEDRFIIKFQDWGIGIKEEDKEKIFAQGFRSVEAKNKNVYGSGLGLTIAKDTMKQLNGDLILSNCTKPTEFHIILFK